MALVCALEDDWRDALDAVASRRGWPTTRDVARLGACVAELSAAYNDPSVARADLRDAGPARLGFSFARDVPKASAAVRELVATRALRLGGRPLRVLDLGAGLGAATWGLVRALEAAGERGIVEATWWDEDARALEVAMEVARERQVRPAQTGRAGIAVRTTTLARPVRLETLPAGGFDVILAAHVLSELDVSALEPERVERHAGLLASLLRDGAGDHGCLVVVEPALRDRTRHLHRVRDALAGRGVTVFAPCLHAHPCPALARETDWCHEDLSVDLPSWLVPVARAAGLRFQGLTFSYLVLRTDGIRLADALPAKPGTGRLRVVSELMRSKGKREAFVCGELGAAGAPPVGTRVRAARLDRDSTDENAAWRDLRRGDVLAVDPAPDAERPRIDRGTEVSPLSDTESR